jgi:hypothetical protein
MPSPTFAYNSTALGFAYCVVLAILALAGQETNATILILVGYLTDTSYGKTIAAALLCGAIGVIYGLVQRRLRQRTIKDFANYRKKFEIRHDPKRTSSMLTLEGETNPIDR